MMPTSQSRQTLFTFVGYVVVSVFCVIILLEFGSFVALSVYRSLRPTEQDNFADISPAYRGYSWAPEYWKEEKARWASQHGNYQPFLVWGVAPYHSQYINTDDSPKGTWRRTINANGECRNKKMDVWMFGGSTLYGTGVPDWATVPSFVSRELNRNNFGCVVVTNFGAEGYVTNQEVILLMEQLKAGARPNVVIFYDGVNDSYAGAVSPGIANAHVSLANVKARVEGSLAGRLDFLKNSYALQLAAMAGNAMKHPTVAAANNEQTETKVAATLDNYEANLRIAKTLGEAYGFHVHAFWQPAFVYGNKALDPFESKIAQQKSAENTFPLFAAVYRQAAQRAATDGTFVFLGNMFDSETQPLYIDKWMHLDPQGNELVARILAKAVSAQ
jgi:lysophospholipase L1-like esterase